MTPRRAMILAVAICGSLGLTAYRWVVFHRPPVEEPHSALWFEQHDAEREDVLAKCRAWGAGRVFADPASLELCGNADDASISVSIRKERRR